MRFFAITTAKETRMTDPKAPARTRRRKAPRSRQCPRERDMARLGLPPFRGHRGGGLTCQEPQRRGDGVPDSSGRPGHCAAVTHHNYGGGVGHYETPHATSDVGDAVTDLRWS